MSTDTPAQQVTPDELADKCEAWLQSGGASNIVDAYEAGYRAALAASPQPTAAPVAWMSEDGNRLAFHKHRDYTTPLYASAAPTQATAAQPLTEATNYARNLAVAIHAKHYAYVTQWNPLPDLLGLLTQIDNMTCALVTMPPPLLDDELTAIIHHERDQRFKDMPPRPLSMMELCRAVERAHGIGASAAPTHAVAELVEALRDALEDLVYLSKARDADYARPDAEVIAKARAALSRAPGAGMPNVRAKPGAAVLRCDSA